MATGRLEERGCRPPGSSGCTIVFRGRANDILEALRFWLRGSPGQTSSRHVPGGGKASPPWPRRVPWLPGGSLVSRLPSVEDNPNQKASLQPKLRRGLCVRLRWNRRRYGNAAGASDLRNVSEYLRAAAPRPAIV